MGHEYRAGGKWIGLKEETNPKGWGKGEGGGGRMSRLVLGAGVMRVDSS